MTKAKWEGVDREGLLKGSLEAGRPSIKPIETEYNGYMFRSRLEARWAVFFDSLGIEYEYEPDGFPLSTRWYLPDFYLPEFGVYVEIKPFDKNVVKHVGDNNKWEKTCQCFRSEVEKAILICYGDPATDAYKYLFAWDSTDSGGGESEFEAQFMCHGDNVYIVVANAREDRNVYVTSGFQSNQKVITAWEWLHLDKYRVDRILREAACEDLMARFDYRATDRLNKAKTAARQARFEHGETPKPRTAPVPSQLPAPSVPTVPPPVPPPAPAKPAPWEYPPAPAPQPPSIK